jgi:hypothetical protein
MCPVRPPSRTISCTVSKYLRHRHGYVVRLRASTAVHLIYVSLDRTAEETESLVRGVELCGGGKWAEIKKLNFRAIQKRSAVDLKDKWRNLMRVAISTSGAR